MSVRSLFIELNKLLEEDELEEAVEVCDKILAVSSNDEEAIICKLQCLLHLGEDRKSVEFVDHPALDSHPFLKAYTLYKCNVRVEESLALLHSVSEDRVEAKLLEAQINYRMGNYDKSVQIYEELWRSGKDRSIELCNNLFASYVACSLADRSLTGDYLNCEEGDSFEYCYNTACALVDCGKLDAGEKMLNVALEKCKHTFENDQEEFDEESRIIRAQLAYVQQLKGQTSKAQELYEYILKETPADEAINAVISNNIIAIRKTRDLFDSLKKSKVIMNENVLRKLTSRQKKIAYTNRALILLHMNKMELAHQACKDLEQEFPESDIMTLFEASAFYREKKYEDAEKLLEESAKSAREDSVLSYAQVLLKDGKIEQAVSTIQSAQNIKYFPGAVSTIISLLLKIGKKNEAISYLEEAIRYWEAKEDSKENVEDIVVLLLTKCSTMLLENSEFERAAVHLENLLRRKAGDSEIVAELVKCYARYDFGRAEQYANSLPPVEEENLSNEDLEQIVSSRGLTRKVRKTEEKEEEAGIEPRRKTTEQKKKKKKKNKPAKNIDPNGPDPERWLPLRDRSYYKKIIGKRKWQEREAHFRGTQGAGTVRLPSERAEEKEAKREQTSTAEQPKQQPPPSNKNKKKDKKGKKRRK